MGRRITKSHRPTIIACLKENEQWVGEWTKSHRPTIIVCLRENEHQINELRPKQECFSNPIHVQSIYISLFKTDQTRFETIGRIEERCLKSTRSNTIKTLFHCHDTLEHVLEQLIHRLQKVQNNLQGSYVELLNLIRYLLSFTPCTGFLLNKELNTNCFSLPLNLYNDGLSYLSDLLKFYIPSWQLRSSSDTRLLCISSFRLKSFGQRKFSYQASVLWNSLPISLRHSNTTLAFKSALKTHLFPS